jgi:hypothetical protein
MYRTTPEAVIAVLTAGKEYDTDNNPSLFPYMDAANSIVNRVVATRRGRVLSPDDQEKIERYLSAHFYCTSDKVYASKSAGGASASYMQQAGKGLEQTPHGQTALRIDYTGVLNGIDKMARARVISIG